MVTLEGGGDDPDGLGGTGNVPRSTADPPTR